MRSLFEVEGIDPEFAGILLGWRTVNGRLVPNVADSASAPSVRLATEMITYLRPGDPQENVAVDTASGRPLELAVAGSLTVDLPKLDPSRKWTVQTGSVNISDFVQYSHLKRVNELVSANAELRTTLGTDYLIKPDIAVSLPARNEWESSFLHAAISCKWTIRSDRVQNIRHENNQMIRHRRERLPHLVTVTAEPLPSRLTSIARGTGEVDAVYHIAFHALNSALENLGGLSREQRAAWDEVTGQGRVRPFSDLSRTLALW